MPNDSEPILYPTDDGETRIDVRLVDESVWLTRAQMVDLFQKSSATIHDHVKKIFRKGEFDESSVVRNFRITAAVGKGDDVPSFRSIGGTVLFFWSLPIRTTVFELEPREPGRRMKMVRGFISVLGMFWIPIVSQKPQVGVQEWA